LSGCGEKRSELVEIRNEFQAMSARLEAKFDEVADAIVRGMRRMIASAYAVIIIAEFGATFFLVKLLGH
jgi:hypothetical protein